MGNGEDIQTSRETAGSETHAAASGDAWLERRLRVFERALNGLEERHERTDRAHSTALGKLEERVTAGEARLEQAIIHFGEGHQALEKAIETASKRLHAPLQEKPVARIPEPRFVAVPEVSVTEAVNENDAEQTAEAASEIAHAEIAQVIDHAVPAKRDFEFLAAARKSAIDAAASDVPPPPRKVQSVTKPLLIGIAALVVTLAAAALFLRHTPGSSLVAASPAPVSGGGIVVRQEVVNPNQRLEVLADAGSRRAMHVLAMQFVESKDMAGAARWFTRAASLGYGDAQFNLAILYERGEGVKQSLVNAFVWYSLAASSGDGEAAERVEALLTQLPPDKLAEADRVIKAFKAATQNATADSTPLKANGQAG